MQAVTRQRTCIHCGTSFQPSARRPDFCCAGCQFVHDLITKNGLGQFYELQENGVPPASSLVFQRRDYAWLEELARNASGSLTLDVQGLSCIGCAWLIEKLFARRPGALAIHVDPTLGQLTLRWQPETFDITAFVQELQTFGYLVGPRGKSTPAASRSLNLRLGLCAALAMNTMLFTLPRYLGMGSDFQFAPLFHRLTLVLGTLSFLIGGSFFFTRTWHALRQGILHIDLPISLGLIAAYAGSLVAWINHEHSFVYFDFVATFTFLMLAGRWLQQKAVERNRHQLLAAQSEPPPVRIATGEKVPVGRLVAGDVITIEPGQVVPVLARLYSEAATLGMEWINGESEATDARRGRLIPAGAINRGQASIELEAREPWESSLLAKLTRITPTGTSRDTAFERFLRRYIAVVLILAVAGFCGWWVATGALLPALQVFISVLVVSCPCASGVALPLCRDIAASRLRRFGVFIRDGGLWSRIDRIRKILFDKTGTLTVEAMTLQNPEALFDLHDDERAVLLGMVHDSLHPVSGCLREQLLAERVAPISAPAPVEETVGFGLQLQHGASTWRLGRAAWAAPEIPSAIADCLFTKDGKPLAIFCFGESARDDAREELDLLRSRHYDLFILSGDRQGKVTAMADRLGIRSGHCFAELSPLQKSAKVRALDEHDTLYLGDGANDSLAVDEAWVSGTPAIDRGLLEQKAGFYFLGRGLRGVRALLDIAAQRRHTARAVVAFAIAYNALAIALSLAGHMNPLLAALLMPASSLVSLAIVYLGFARRPR